MVESIGAPIEKGVASRIAADQDEGPYPILGGPIRPFLQGKRPEQSKLRGRHDCIPGQLTRFLPLFLGAPIPTYVISVASLRIVRAAGTSTWR